MKVRLILLLMNLKFGLPLSCERESNSHVNYKILVLMPWGSHSHRSVLFPIAEALANRGHEVTFISGLDPVPSESPTLRQIKHNITYESSIRDLFEKRQKPISVYENYAKILPYYARNFYSIPDVVDLYKRRDHFDVFIVDAFFNEFTYPFVYQKPFILCNVNALNPLSSSITGNVPNPSFVPGFNVKFDTPRSIFERIVNIYEYLDFGYRMKYSFIRPAVEKQISEQFPELPSLSEIERNVSLMFINSHFSLGYPPPLLPSQIEIGGHVCRKPKPLPKELEEFINDAESGVVYFALGGALKSKDIPVASRKVLMEAFSKIPQRVLMRYDNDDTDNVPKNVFMSKWLPQQDILGHKNVKLLITHGGRLSYIEAMCHSMPLLVLPIGGDQFRNSEIVKRKGLGGTLSWEGLTPEKIVAAIFEITSQEKYRDTMSKASRELHDQPMHPLDKAVWWTEYVARNKGAASLRSPMADLSWTEFFMLDILAALHLIVFFTFIAIFKYIFGKKYKMTKTKIFNNKWKSS